MNWNGLVIGAATFLCIGIFHPLVIKAEYYFGDGCWWVFLVAGISSLAASLFLTQSYVVSTILGVVGFSCFWSILEIKKQAERVRKGWFPKNPRRSYNEKKHTKEHKA